MPRPLRSREYIMGTNGRQCDRFYSINIPTMNYLNHLGASLAHEILG